MKRLFCTLMLLCLCAGARAEIMVAMRAIERGHYVTAERALRKSAAEGDARAQNNLAYLYERGLGVPQSYSEAVALYNRAAALGLTEAKYNLATLHHSGKGVPRSFEKARPLYAAAAHAGYADAEYMLGTYYRGGLGGLDKDGALALSWFLRAARHGHSGAQLIAASIYLSGEGWRSEPQKALVWAEMARQNGETQAAALATMAAKVLRAEQLQDAAQQASTCLRSSYRECPE